MWSSDNGQQRGNWSDGTEGRRMEGGDWKTAQRRANRVGADATWKEQLRAHVERRSERQKRLTKNIKGGPARLEFRRGGGVPAKLVAASE